jgi:hypothetical protein
MPTENKGDTLADLKAKDIDNWQHLMKQKGERFFYDKMQTAFGAYGEFLRQALIRVCDVDMRAVINKAKNPDQGGHILDAALAQKGVQVEERNYKNSTDHDRAGLYVYKNNEIAAFIGKIQKHQIMNKLQIYTTERIS